MTVSIDYFVKKLGFQVDFEGPGLFVGISRGHCCLFLAQSDQGNPGSWTWIGVSDVDELHEELLGKGARLRQGPTNFSWAYEIQVVDPDGNVFRFGSPSKPDRPFGPWLDMQGVLWEL